MVAVSSSQSSRSDNQPALVLKNGRVVNVFSGEIELADVAIQGGRIVGVGEDYVGKSNIDLDGAFVAPGLIDAHVHIESSLCLPPQFAAAVVPRGVTTVIADPHEIANVAGADGIRFMAAASKGLPLRVILMAPSCVPATDMATAGAELTAADLSLLARERIVYGLAEVMNFPGVIAGDPSVLAKLRAFRSRPIDGHAPGVRGKALSAYVAAGIGSDHECTTVEEAKEKLARGLYILIREATNAHNLDTLLPLITPANSRRVCFCTDDRQPADLLGQGTIDYMIRKAIAFGIEPVTAIRMATLNPAEWFGLHDRGAIAPGRIADLIVFDDLASPTPRAVFTGGVRYAPKQGGGALEIPITLLRTCNTEIKPGMFRIESRGKQVRVIGSRPDQLVTDHLIREASTHSGGAVADCTRDLLKMAVIARHGKGGVGLGFIEGIGLTSGAIAGTVAHDHHNLIVIGCDDQSMTTAATAVSELGGGLCVATDDKVMASLALPIAGLMSDRPVAVVRDAYDQLLAAARELGSTLHDPFMAMSFMALEVIPSLKLTDQGLVDVDTFERVELFVS